MTEERSVFDNKLFVWMRKVDLFVTLFHAAWSFMIVVAPIFTEYECLVFDIPVLVVAALSISIVCLGVFVKVLFFKNRNELYAILIYLIFNACFPLLFSIIMLNSDIEDLFYDFSGVFLGGLGVALIRIFAIIMSIAFLVIFGAVKLIKKMIAKKRAGRPETGKAKLIITRIKDILNILSLAAIIISIVLITVNVVKDEICITYVNKL